MSEQLAPGRCYSDGFQYAPSGEKVECPGCPDCRPKRKSLEQRARDIMEACGWEGAQDTTAGDVVFLSNVLRDKIAAEQANARLRELLRRFLTVYDDVKAWKGTRDIPMGWIALAEECHMSDDAPSVTRLDPDLTAISTSFIQPEGRILSRDDLEELVGTAARISAEYAISPAEALNRLLEASGVLAEVEALRAQADEAIKAWSIEERCVARLDRQNEALRAGKEATMALSDERYWRERAEKAEAVPVRLRNMAGYGPLTEHEKGYWKALDDMERMMERREGGDDGAE